MSKSLIKEVEYKIILLEEEAVKIAEQEKSRLKNIQSILERQNSIAAQSIKFPHGNMIEDETQELRNINREIKEIETNLKNEKENKKIAKKKNNEEFFRPLKASIEKTEKAIELVTTNPEEAEKLFVEIKEIWPGNTDFLLNLAKFYYENNELLEAIDCLILFIERTSPYNYYHNLIKNFLNFDMKEFQGENKDIKFNIKNEEITLEEVFSTENLILPFNYRVPVDMKIQPYDKLPIQGNLDAREYQFLMHNQAKVNSVSTLEICLPINYLSEFVNTFIGDIKDKYGFYNYLINLDQIYLLMYVNETKIEALKNERNYLDDAIYQVQDLERDMNYIVPIIVVQVEEEQQVEVFVEEYKRFVMKYVIPQKNLRQLLNDKKISYKEEEKNIHYQSIMESQMYDSLAEADGKVMAESFIKVNVIPYANLVVMLDNLKNEVHPHIASNDIVYRKAFNRYLDNFGEKYKNFKFSEEKKLNSKVEISELRIYKDKSGILERMKDKERKREIDKEWDIVIENYREKDNVKSMVAMRKTLEILAYAHYLSAGDLIPQNIDLDTQYKRLNNFIKDDEISSKIDKIRSYANQKVHYYRPDERKFTDLNKVSREEMYHNYRDVLAYYITELRL